MTDYTIGLLVASVIVNAWIVPVTASSDDLFEILQGPKHMTVFQDQRATFRCRIEGPGTIETKWDVNGTSYHRSILSGGSITYQTLNATLWDFFFRFPARVEYNSSRIQCRVTIFQPGVSGLNYTYSNNATLTIQGPPDAVSDLRVESHGYHLMVTWQAPFSLDVTGVEYDITYSLLISNVTNETQPAAVSCAVCRNFIHPNFTFSPPHPLPGHTFTFTVTPQNGAGGGPQSHPVTAALTDDDGSDIQQSRSPVMSYSHRESFTVMSFSTVTVFPTQTPTTATSSSSDRENSETQKATFYGIISVAILLFLLISFGIVILFCCGARRWQKSRSNFSMEPNPIYEIRGDIPTKNRFFMEQNPVYEIRGHIPTKNRFFMEQNPVYEIRGHIPTSKNIAYTATVL